MDVDLLDAAYEGNIGHVYDVIVANPHVLDYFDSLPFVQSPLHVAVRMGHTNFALEIMRLKPSLSKKLDTEGWCPFHVALQDNQSSTVYRLLETLSVSKEGRVSLHCTL